MVQTQTIAATLSEDVAAGVGAFQLRGTAEVQKPSYTKVGLAEKPV